MATTPQQQSAERDYFTDRSVLLDPYDFFEGVRARGPVAQLEARDALLVTGFDECVEVLLNKDDFSSAIATSPIAPLAFAPEGDDIAGQVEAYARSIRLQDLLVNYDGEFHAAARSLLNPLFVPSRLKANEAFMHDLADRMAREMVRKGGGEIIAEVATPYVTLVIADLLGVPDEDRQQFRDVIDQGAPAGDMDNADGAEAAHASAPLIFMGTYFARYLAERRATPRDDVMTLLANAKFPDGSTPDIVEPAKAAMFLFAAGQDTSAKLLGNSMRYLAENPEMQDRLRADRSLIPAFMEEMLRLEGSTKATFRLALRNTRIGEVEVPAGKRVVVGLAAANRDPRRWDDPASFRLDRPRIKEHLAFGRGAHVCAGSPLARAEVRVLLDRFLEHTRAITLCEEQHGPAGARRLDYEPSYIIRGLDRLHIRLEPR